MSSSGHISTWESKSSLLEHLEALGTRTLLIGGNAEAPRSYCSISLSSRHGPVEIGVISSGLGSSPAAAVFMGGQQALIGHDTWITWIDLETPSVVSCQRLGGVFFEFLAVDGDLVVLHELGALRADATGATKWSVDTDVVESWRTEADGTLVLTVMDAPAVCVSLDSGVASAG